MSDKHGQNDEAKWHFFWKNIDGLGRLMRLSLGIGLLVAAREMKEDKTKSGLLSECGLAVRGGLFQVDVVEGVVEASQ
jgi:hypothetical protein